MTYFRERILDGRLPEGTRLPTELALAAEHQISRDTVRQALALLVDEGLLERVPRRGTFVKQSSPMEKVEANQSNDKRIGLVLNRPPASQLNMDILIGVEQAAKSHGYHVSFTYAEENQAQQARDIARLLNSRVQGLIIFPVSNSMHDESILHLQEEQVPFVLIDRYIPDIEADYVGPDNIGGGYRATEHLLILGHKRIAFMKSYDDTLQTTSVRDRWEGYRKALHEYNIPYDESLLVPQTDTPKIAMRECYEAFLSRADRPGAVFAVNDIVALELMKTAQHLGIHIPQDLALVGFDDLSYAAHLSPPLTTVAQPLMDVGLRAGNLLISRIEGRTGPSEHIELPTSLIVRESCGARLRVRSLTSTP